MLSAPDLQALVRKIYIAEGVDRVTASQETRHEAQRRYTIERRTVRYVATKKGPTQ